MRFFLQRGGLPRPVSFSVLGRHHASAGQRIGPRLARCPAPGYDSASVLHALQREAKFRRHRRNQPDQSPTEYFFVMKTFTAKSETVQRDWYLVDATDKTLGRLSAEIAHRLRGKHKPVYTPHVDTGDYIIVVNAEKIAVTGKKMTDKLYHRFTGYIGNLKTETLGQALERHPERVIEIAVKGMLPKNPLGRAMYRKLKVYKGAEHPHAAQQPQPLEL